MGNCSSQLDCRAEIYFNDAKEPLEVDPDIAGPGVLASFIISAAFAIFAIAVGYFTDSLPRRHLHKIDRVFIRQSREAWIFSKLGPRLKKTLLPLRRAAHESNVFRIRLDSVPREIRSEALLRFLLVNSDQQLVTGLAVLTGGLATRCKLSGYELQIVASLAWFSTTTHLATLTVLTNYFREHPEVLLLRLVGMGATLIILCFIMTVDILKNSLQRAPWRCAIGNYKDDWQPILVLCVLLIYLVGAFITRIVNLVVEAHRTEKELKQKARELSRELSESKSLTSQEREKKRELSKQIAEISHHDSHEESGFINSYAKMILWLYAHLTGDLQTGPEFHRILPIALKNAENQRDAHFESATSTATKKSWIFYADLLSVDYCNSFAFGFSILVFAFSFGIAQTIQAKNYTQGIRLSEGATEWGFGQIVPLFLLSLPMLAATEIYCESRRKAHSHFYALAIAEGEAEGEGEAKEEADESSRGLVRTDTITPKPYTTFFDDWHVRYGLRVAIWGSTTLLAFAGVDLEADITGLGTAGAIIIGLSVLFAIYATLREVYLIRKGMKEVIMTEANEVTTETKEASVSHDSQRVDEKAEDKIQTVEADR